MDEITKFNMQKAENIKKLAAKKTIGLDFILSTYKLNYQQNFTWLGVPIIQYPQDIIAMQEIIWDVKPDLIIETGVARGGSVIFYSSMLSLLELSGEIKDGKVLGIDIDIREHNKKVINEHKFSSKIHLLEGSSIDESVIYKVYEFAKCAKKVLVCLDSNHTHSHVLAELKAYAKLVSVNSYCVVFDTGIEDMPKGSFPDRPWDKDNNPKTAVWEFLKENNNFEIDESIENKLIITAAYNGFLKRVK